MFQDFLRELKIDQTKKLFLLFQITCLWRNALNKSFLTEFCNKISGTFDRDAKTRIPKLENRGSGEATIPASRKLLTSESYEMFFSISKTDHGCMLLLSSILTWKKNYLAATFRT